MNFERSELLAPAKNMECLIKVIQHGADSVYMGYPEFNARMHGKNFSVQEFKTGVEYAHKNNVKVYLTLNTLIKESEINRVLKYAEQAIKDGVDAILVQDVGLASLLHLYFPKTKLHASTQMTIANHYGTQILKKIGFDRVVLARELNKQEIIRIYNIDCSIELEIFIHGGLCIGYSGQCFASTFCAHYAANRGLCKMPCWSDYILLKDKEVLDKGVLIRPRDLCGLKILDKELLKCVSAFKIQGRLRSSSYISKIVDVYRKSIDDIRKNQFEEKKIMQYEEELLSVSERGLTYGNLALGGCKNLIMDSEEKKAIEFIPSMLNDKSEKIYDSRSEKNISVLLQTINENYNYSKLDSKIYRIYIPYCFFLQKEIEEIIKNTCNRYQTYIYMPNMILERNIEEVYNSIEIIMKKYVIKGIVLSNMSDLALIYKYRDYNLHYICNFPLHIMNHFSAEAMKTAGANEGTLSLENSVNENKEIIFHTDFPLEQIVYGHPALMHMKYCVLEGKNECGNCLKEQCKESTINYSLAGDNYFDLQIEKWQTTTVLYSKKILSIAQHNWIGNTVRIDFLNENIEEMNRIITDLKEGYYYTGDLYENTICTE